MSALEPNPQQHVAVQPLKHPSPLPCAPSTTTATDIPTATATAASASPDPSFQFVQSRGLVDAPAETSDILLSEVAMATCERAEGDGGATGLLRSAACLREAVALEESVRASEKYRLEREKMQLRKRVQLESVLKIQLAEAKLSMAEIRCTLIQTENERDTLKNHLQQLKLSSSKPATHAEHTANQVDTVQKQLLAANDSHRNAVQELAKVKNARDFATKESASWKKQFDRAQDDLTLLKSRCEQLEQKNRHLEQSAAQVPEKPDVQHAYHAHIDNQGARAVKSDAPTHQDAAAAAAADAETHNQNIPGLACLISPAPLQRKPPGISAPSDVVSESRSRYTATLPFPDLIGTSAKENTSEKASLPAGRRPASETNIQEKRADRKRKALGAPGADTRNDEKSAPNVPKRPRQSARSKPQPASAERGQAAPASEKTVTEPGNQGSEKLEKREAGGRMLRARPRISYDYDKKGRDVMITNKAYEIDFDALRPAALKPPKSRKSMPALPTSRTTSKKAAGLGDRSKRKKSGGPSIKSQKRRS